MKIENPRLFDGRLLATQEYVDDVVNLPDGVQTVVSESGKIQNELLPFCGNEVLRVTEVVFTTEDTTVSGGSYTLSSVGGYCVYVHDGESAVEFEVAYSSAANTSTITMTSLDSSKTYRAYLVEAEGSAETSRFTPDIITIPAATSTVELTDGCWVHTPAAAPTYVLPNVTDTTHAHTIILDVAFTSALSVAFEDAAGNTLVPQKDFSIVSGDHYRFTCLFQFGEWFIVPLKLVVAGE